MASLQIASRLIASTVIATSVLLPFQAVAQPIVEEDQPAVQTAKTSRDQRQTHHAQGLIFETPMGFSEVKNLGNSMVGVVARKGNKQLRIAWGHSIQVY
ncbi:MAG: hypothetical protein HC792_05620 [Acaryochloridaceae cyanobacterium CSU_5_19]|nr:hypothetical protein [Acaryochloridaceae cyanobacterium CSU_5_19]